MEVNQMHMQDDEMEIDLKELFFVLLKKAWLILLVGILLAAGAGYYTKKYITPQYQSSSMLYVLGKSTSITSLADIQLGTQLTKDYVVLVKSRTVLNKVIENLKLDITYEEMNAKVSVTNQTDTRIIKITATDPDPVVAKEIADEVADVAKRTMAEIMVTDEPNIVEEGVVNKHPVSPNTLKNCAMAGVLGVFVTCFIIVVIYLMNDTIKTAEDVEKYLGISTLGSIPMDGKRKKKRRRR